jgi:ATP-dependent exoDNAse (exonuclease V) beta subunit
MLLSGAQVFMISDQAQRDLALDPSRSFIVQAPAGSGKTDLLVKRFLLLLSRSKPEEVLAITFTKKAAAEMRKRVLKELPNAADIAHRLRIETIDAFCLGLARQTPVLAQLGAQPETVEDASAFYLESSFQTLSRYENPSVAKLLAHLDNDVEASARLLAGMLARRDQWLRRTGNPPGRAEIESALKFERELLLSRAKELHPKASEAFALEVLTTGFEWRKRHPLYAKLSGNEPLRLALRALLRMPPATYEPAQWEALEAILALLPLAAAELKALFAAKGIADFTEVLQGAVRALGATDDPTNLLLSLDKKINHVLVDEFQDTSISQWDLLRLLTAGWQAEDGRTLFLVGDPMQSIYRFREAEVALFLRARREGLGSVRLEPVTLTTNFRSQEKLVSFFNASFPRVFPGREDESSGAVPYSPSTASHAPLPGEAAAFHLFENTAQEANKIVQLVQSAQGTCAILVRNRAHLDAVVPALKAQGLRFRAIEIELLGEKQVVQDLYALTRALLHPGDRIAWLAVLRAPWCGLTLSDLLTLVAPAQAGAQVLTIWESLDDDRVVCKLSEDGRKRAQRLWAPLGQAIKQHSLRGTLRERVESVWLALGGPACAESATELEDAEIYLDALEQVEEAGSVDVAALHAKLEKLYALPDLEAPERLQVMTIHKAKGLEFDTVIVPGLDRVPRASDPPLFQWKQRPTGKFIFAPIKEAGAEKNLAYDYLARLERDADDLEAGRLLYVAATRAKQRLHLLGCIAFDDHDEPRAPDKRSLLAKLWPLDDPITRAATPAAPASGLEPFPLRRLPADYSLPAPPPPVKWDAPPEGRDEEPIEFSWAGETARHVGTVVHRWLQRIAEDELKGWDVKRVESLRPHFLADLKRRGVQDPGPAAELVVTAVRNSITSERGHWLLGPRLNARSEYKIRAYQRSLVVDRFFSDENGIPWIADYKINSHRGTDVDSFLDREYERYLTQLLQYKNALGSECRSGLYFPLYNGWRGDNW